MRLEFSTFLNKSKVSVIFGDSVVTPAFCQNLINRLVKGLLSILKFRLISYQKSRNNGVCTDAISFFKQVLEIFIDMMDSISKDDKIRDLQNNKIKLQKHIEEFRADLR
ncbi:hypothetical protein NPIL_161611 [Nephila pilipes]|uniref:Uncharacterized protein n=1 Tax=Nephila pilipes TaxID=299642 RepID=A0A8X6MAF7_NEPPI|nr:hypothetical protein NPIL_161611 [Nephila pilipes]